MIDRVFRVLPPPALEWLHARWPRRVSIQRRTGWGVAYVTLWVGRVGRMRFVPGRE